MKKNTLIYVIYLLMTMTFCKKDEKIGSLKKGYTTGKALDTKGEPLENVDCR